MPKAICPICDENIKIEEAEAYLFNQVRCPKCDALLEIVEESPLELEEIPEEEDEDV